VLGFPAIAAGRAIVTDAARTGYVVGVFGNVWTTLLLVGIVVLLERRIVDMPCAPCKTRTTRRAGSRTSTPAASRPTAATPSGTDRSLEREGVSSPDEQTLHH
jgi:hypothetical protein